MKRTVIYRIFLLVVVSAFLVNRAYVFSYADEILTPLYVPISEDLIDIAYNEDNYNIKVNSYEEIYGTRIEELTTLSYEEIAKYELCNDYGEDNFVILS